MRFGELYRERREAAGVGLSEAARMAGIRPGYLSQVERGLRNPPSPAVIDALAGVLPNVEAEDLHDAASRERPIPLDVSGYSDGDRRRVVALSRRLEAGDSFDEAIAAVARMEHGDPQEGDERC